MRKRPVAAALIMAACCITTAHAADCAFIDDPALRNALVAWLECESCADEALKTVLAYENLIPCFESILVGLDAEGDSIYEQQVRDAYDQIERYENVEATTVDAARREAYVARELANRRARLKSRAAAALSRYSIDAARPALTRSKESLSGSSAPSDQRLFEFIDRTVGPAR
jgi:hypothetical protein